MNSAEILVSQAPIAGDYLHAVNVWWSASRHPENVADILDAGKESARELSSQDKAILLGTTGITGFQQLPTNEMLVGVAAGATMAATGGNILAAAAVSGGVTATSELLSGLGVAYCAEKLRPAMDVISNRYINKQKIQEQEAKREARGKSSAGDIARIYAIASLVLTSGTVLYENLRNRERTPRDNLRTVAIAAGGVTLNYTVSAAVVLGAARGVEWAGVDNATEVITDVISNPLTMGAVVGSIFGIVKWKERRAILKKISQKDQNEDELSKTQITESSQPERRRSLPKRIFTKKSPTNSSSPVEVTG